MKLKKGELPLPDKINMKFIIGKKIEMTQVWKDGRVSAVTKVKVDPCFISQVKSADKDGYEALQLAFGEKKERRIKKPQLNHLKKAGLKSARIMKEFRAEGLDGFSVGDIISINNFSEGDIISVTGISKGKGFAGVVKRHGFSGSKKTHGNKDQLRMPGSAGATGPGHVFKGTRMGGRMGGNQVTTKNLVILGVDLENNILLISGAVPGSRNSFVFVKAAGELKVEKPKAQEAIAEKEEVIPVENAVEANKGSEAEDNKKETEVLDNKEPISVETDNISASVKTAADESASVGVSADKGKK